MAPGTRFPHELALIGLALVSGLAPGCRVPPPTLEQVLQLGYLTPEQAYESWRTAIQGNLLVEEYQSLSKDWRRRNGDGVVGVSLFGYSEVRDFVLEQRPHLRLALKLVEPPQLIARSSDEVIMQARIPGPLWFPDHWLWVRLVREGFTSVHTIDLPDRATHGTRDIDVLGTRVLTARRDGDDTTLEARVRVPTVTDDGTEWPRDVVLMQVGWEWKIDDFDVLPAPVPPSESAR